MATAKTKNGNAVQEAMVDATKVAEEAKEMVNNWVEMSAKVMEDTKPVLDAQQKLLENNYSMWYEAGKTYLDLWTKATEQNLAQSLAFQKEIFKVVQANVNETQELLTAEQAFVFATLESAQQQMKEASDTLGKMFAQTR